MWSACQPLTSSLNPKFSISQRWWPKPTARSVETDWTGSVVTQIQSLVFSSSLPSSCRRTEYVSRERKTRTGVLTCGHESRSGKSHHKHFLDLKEPSWGRTTGGILIEVAPFILEYDQGVFAPGQKEVEERRGSDHWRSRAGDLILDK